MRLIVPFARGGTTDIFARLLAQRLTDGLRSSFYVENITGASGNIAAAQAARAAPDGHAIFVAFTSFVVNPSFLDKVPYEPNRDFDPVTLAVTSTTVLTVKPSVLAKTVSDLVSLIKENPGKYNFASPGAGTPAHLAGEMFRLSRGLDLVHVPFGGGAASAIVSVVSGHTPIGFTTLASADSQIKAGGLRALERFPVTMNRL